MFALCSIQNNNDWDVFETRGSWRCKMSSFEILEFFKIILRLLKGILKCFFNLAKVKWFMEEPSAKRLLFSMKIFLPILYLHLILISFLACLRISPDFFNDHTNVNLCLYPSLWPKRIFTAMRNVPLISCMLWLLSN